ncbi:MAG: hypothetical protein AUH35_02040 [Nitrospirae bacterium 13_1_40CM_62_7]|nr:MAG: hypothetical protein AUH35_02040 [Nitrospirae bacterium 13_1_40CM_62_7]
MGVRPVTKNGHLSEVRQGLGRDERHDNQDGGRDEVPRVREDQRGRKDPQQAHDLCPRIQPVEPRIAVEIQEVLIHVPLISFAAPP